MGTTPTQVVSINPFSPEFQQAAKIAAIQTQVATTNANNKAEYLLQAQDWLVNAVHARDLGQQIPAVPPPPLMLHVDANGNETSGPDFVAQPPVLPAPTGTLGSGGAIASTNPAPDRIDAIMAGLAEMYTDIQAIKTKLGA